MFALLFFIADVTLSGTDSKFLPIYIKKAKHYPGKNSMLTRPMLNIQNLFTNYDIITDFLNLAFCSEHFISIKHRILATFNINKKFNSNIVSTVTY
jgi:hypothetical protein